MNFKKFVKVIQTEEQKKKYGKQTNKTRKKTQAQAPRGTLAYFPAHTSWRS